MPRRNLIPELHLSKQEEYDLRDLCNDLEREIVSQYEEFVNTRQCEVDLSQWRMVESLGDLHAYRERDDGNQHTMGMPCDRRAMPRRRASTGNGPQSLLAKTCHASQLLLAGHVCCTMDEAAYALSFQDTASLRARNAYHEERTAASGVVCVLEDGNKSGIADPCPFRFLGVTWSLCSDKLGGLVSSRDSLALSHLSYSHRSNGDVIGVWLQHSIQLPHKSETTTTTNSCSLPTVRRVQASRAMVFRAVGADRLELFLVGFDEPLGNAAELLHAQHSVHALLQMNDLADIAHKKKMYRTMQLRARLGTPSLRQRASSAPPVVCGLCQKSLRSLVVFTHSGRCCQFCQETVCARCIVTKKIVIDASTEPVECKSIETCLACTMAVKSRDVRELARQEVRERAPRSHQLLMSHANREYPELEALRVPVLGGFV